MTDDVQSSAKALEKLRVRVSAAEKLQLQSEAAAVQLSLNEFCRRRLLGKPTSRAMEVAQLGALEMLAQAIRERRVGHESDAVLRQIESDIVAIEVASLSREGAAGDRQAD
jgi:hypothetical protein